MFQTLELLLLDHPLYSMEDLWDLIDILTDI